MKVPLRRTPGTSVVAVTEGYAQGGGALDFRPVTDQVNALQQDLRERQAAAEEFDLQKRFIQETNELTQDFETRKQEQPLGAQGFTDQVNTDYTTRHEALLNEYWKQGYSEKSLQGLALRLGSLRQSFGERALAFQTQSTGALAEKELGDFTVGLSQYATNDPNGYASSAAELRTAVDRFPGLTAEQKDKLYEGNVAIIRQGAAKGLAMSDPMQVIKLLDPQGFTAPITSAAGAYKVIEGLDQPRSEVANELSAGGLPAPVIAGFLGNFDVEAGYGGAQGDSGSASGIAQWRNARRQNFVRMFGKDPHNATHAEQAKFVVWEMNNPAQAGMSTAQRDAILAARTPEEAAALIDQHYERSSGEHRAARLEAAKLYGSLQTIDPGVSSVQQAPDPTTLAPNEQTQAAVDGKTGNPILDEMTGPERLQVLGWAREQQNRVTAQVKGAMDIAIANAEASIATGNYAGPQLTKDQVITTYGPLEGEQKWAQYEGALQTGQVVQRIKTLNPAEMQREVERLRPDPASPTLAVDTQLYQAAQRAAASVMSQRESDPAAYVYTVFPEVGQALANAKTSGERKAAFAQLIRAYDKLGVPQRDRTAFNDDMLEEYSDQYNRANHTQKLDMIESALVEMGPLAGRTLGAAGGKEIAQDLVTYSMIRRSPNYRNLFLDIQRGKAIIAQDPARRPAREEINTAFFGGINTAINNLSPEVSRSMNESAAAIYVQRGGRTGTGVFDQKLYDAALREALGGSAANAQTGAVDMNQGRVTEYTILPPGVTKPQFENWIERLQPGDLTRLSEAKRPPTDRSGRPLPLEDIVGEGVFIMLAPGKYGIKMGSDGGWVMDGRGQRFVVDLQGSTVR